MRAAGSGGRGYLAVPSRQLIRPPRAHGRGERESSRRCATASSSATPDTRTPHSSGDLIPARAWPTMVASVEPARLGASTATGQTGSSPHLGLHDHPMAPPRLSPGKPTVHRRLTILCRRTARTCRCSGIRSDPGVHAALALAACGQTHGGTERTGKRTWGSFGRHAVRKTDGGLAC